VRLDHITARSSFISPTAIKRFPTAGIQIDPALKGIRRSSDFQQMEFLWVRWLGQDRSNDYHEGWRSRCLPRIGFVDCEDDLAFGFLNPALIIRAVHLIHLILCFNSGRTKLHLPRRSICCPAEEKDMFYVKMCVDIDL